MQPTPSLAFQAQMMIAQVHMRGQTPLVFLMNQTTIQTFIEQALVQQKRKMSRLLVFWFWLRNRNVEPKLEYLHGVPVMPAPHLPHGAMFLQVAPYLNPENQPQAGGAPVAQQQAGMRIEEAPMPQFAERQQVDPIPDSDRVPTIDDLAADNDRPSVSSVIMRALERADDLKGVAVVRLYKNGSVDLCANLGQFELQGVLQHAQVWVLQNGKD